MVKNPPAKKETRVRSYQKYSLEEEMTSHSSILAREIPWIEEPGGLQSMGLQRFGHSDKLCLFFFFFQTSSYGLFLCSGNTMINI